MNVPLLIFWASKDDLTIINSLTLKESKMQPNDISPADLGNGYKLSFQKSPTKRPSPRRSQGRYRRSNSHRLTSA